jgi:ketose-bisphosphate aldolase
MKGLTLNQRMNLCETNITEIMQKAFLSHILIPAFNIAYLPMLKPIISALKEMDCFGLVEVARVDIEKFGAQNLASVKLEYRKHADRIYTRLHEDHVPVIDENLEFVNWKKMIQEALDLDFDSVMIDGSRLSLEENIEVTRKVVNMAHDKGIPVEAELGAVFGHEKEPLPSYEKLFLSRKGFTDPIEAKKFVKETEVDWLSVAIGNIHGAISGVAKDKKKIDAKLNIEWLQQIVQATKVPIVLHGGSGIKQESVLAGIKNGVTKINIGTVIRQRFEKVITEKGNINIAQQHVREETKKLIKDYYHIQGSAQKLASLL